MPLNKDERKMKRNLEETYGKERGEKVFYAMERQGRTPNSDRSKAMMGKKKGYAMGGMTTYNAPATANTMQQQKSNMPNMGMGMQMAKGGMVKKKGYAKGGMVKCGASNPATQKSTPKK